MLWVTALVKAILEWLTELVKQDTKASDADDIPKRLKNRWRDRINKQLEKQNKENETTEKPDDNSPSD